MPATRILIDTDDLRKLAQYTEASLDELAAVRTDLYRVLSMLSGDPRTAAVHELLANLEQLGTVMVQDRRALLDEVATLEAGEGVSGADAAFAAGQAGWSAIDARGMYAMLLDIIARRSAPTITPAPWNEGWQSASGVVNPAGGFTTPQWRDAWYTGDKVSLEGGDGPLKVWVVGGYEAHSTAESSSSSDATSAQAHVTTDAGASVWGGFGVRAPGLSAAVTGRASVSTHSEFDVSGGAKDGNLQAHVGGSTEMKAGAQVEAHADTPVGSASAQAHAETEMRGAAEANASVGEDGAKAGVSAGGFSGASAGAGAKYEGPGGIGAGVGAEGRVGVGAEVSASGELSVDRVGFSLDVGAALGIGAGIHLDLGFSPSAMWEGAKDFFKDPGGSFEKMWDGVKNTASDVGDLVKPSTWEHMFDKPSPPPAPAAAPAPAEAPPGVFARTPPPTRYGDAAGGATRYVGNVDHAGAAPWHPDIH